MIPISAYSKIIPTGGAESDDALLRVSGQIGSVSLVDWLHDRSDNLLYSAHPDIGYVFLCPFNFTTWELSRSLNN